MTAPKQEIPPVSKVFILEYDHRDKNYPVLGITRNPNEGLGMTPPVLGTPCPDTRYPDHILTELRVTHPDNRLIWVYQILPGPSITESSWDKKMYVLITETRTEKVLSAITESIVVNTGVSLIITENKEINAAKGIEIVTTIPLSPFNSYANAVQGQRFISKKFPARAVYPTNSPGTVIEVYEPIAQRIPVTTRRWYAISATPPAVAVDSIILGPANIYYGFSRVYGDDILHDTGEGALDGSASTPSYSTYMGQAPATYTLTNGTATVTGVDSHFTADFKVGSQITWWIGTSLDITNCSNVVSIEGDTSMTISPSYGGTTTTVPYKSHVGGGWYMNTKIMEGEAKDIGYGLLWEMNTIEGVML